MNTKTYHTSGRMLSCRCWIYLLSTIKLLYPADIQRWMKKLIRSIWVDTGDLGFDELCFLQGPQP